jgi:hypothetical protein
MTKKDQGMSAWDYIGTGLGGAVLGAVGAGIGGAIGGEMVAAEAAAAKAAVDACVLTQQGVAIGATVGGGVGGALGAMGASWWNYPDLDASLGAPAQQQAPAPPAALPSLKEIREQSAVDRAKLEARVAYHKALEGALPAQGGGKGVEVIMNSVRALLEAGKVAEAQLLLAQLTK